MTEAQNEGIRQHLAAILAADVVSYVANLAMAYYLSGRYEDAVVTARQAWRRSPTSNLGRFVEAAALAQLSRADAAQDAAEAVLRVRPFFTIDWFVASLSDPEDAAHMADGLRKAGLPETPSRSEP